LTAPAVVTAIETLRTGDRLGRLVLTGSPHARSVDDRYECERPRECSGRDIVPEALWRRLPPGQAISAGPLLVPVPTPFCCGDQVVPSKLDENILVSPGTRRVALFQATVGICATIAGT
jgi:hypothetical protein